MTALSSDDDSADASFHVTSTCNTSLLTYHWKSRSNSSIIIFSTAMHADSSKWPLPGNAGLQVKRQIASDCCDHVGDDELVHNSQNDIHFASDHCQAMHAVAHCCSTRKLTKKKTTFENHCLQCYVSEHHFADKKSSASRQRYVSVSLPSATQCSKHRSTGSDTTIGVLTVACGT